MLACLHEEALRAQEAALLCYGISKDFHAGSRLIRTETTLPSRNQHIPAGETGAFLRYLLTSLDMESSCNKLFRTELLKKNGILFNTSAVVFEDFQFVLDYLSACAPDIILLKKAFYHYRAQETENGAAKRSRFNLVRDIDALTTKFLAWASTLSLPQEDIPIVKGYILQKISVFSMPSSGSLMPRAGKYSGTSFPAAWPPARRSFPCAAATSTSSAVCWRRAGTGWPTFC